MWLIYVFIQHTNNKTGFSQTTSFVYQFSVVWSVSKFIERDCFIRQRVVQNVIWVAQYFLKQFFITVCAVTMGCQHCWANGFFGSLSCLTNKYACLLARSTNSAMVGTSPERKPDRLPRRRTAYYALTVSSGGKAPPGNWYAHVYFYMAHTLLLLRR